MTNLINDDQAQEWKCTTPFDSACWSSLVEIPPLLSLSTLKINPKIILRVFDTNFHPNSSTIYCI